jgi:hypothetical protein
MRAPAWVGSQLPGLRMPPRMPLMRMPLMRVPVRLAQTRRRRRAAP